MLVWQAQDEKPSWPPVTDSLTDFKVTVHTADVADAGTDADVSLVMYSSQGNALNTNASTGLSTAIHGGTFACCRMLFTLMLLLQWKGERPRNISECSLALLPSLWYGNMTQ